MSDQYQKVIKYTLIFLLMLIVIAVAYSIKSRVNNPQTNIVKLNEEKITSDTKNSKLDMPTMEEPDDVNTTTVEYDIKNLESNEVIDKYNGKLVDVTGGKTIGGYKFDPNAQGTFKYGLKDDKTYELFAQAQDLPDLSNGDFYEGWLVRVSPFKFISTGKMEKIEGVVDNTYVNHFTSDIDYSDYKMYVLTLEPDDGDPAPADHILEGFSIDFKE